MTEIPEHLKHIDFKPWHFWSNTYNGKTTFSLNDNFTDEIMQALNLGHTAKVTITPYGEKELLVMAEVWIFDKTVGPTGNLTPSTPGFASVAKMPSESTKSYDGQRKERQTHYAQLAVTRAISTALQRHIGISGHDVEIIVENLGIKPEMTKAREYSSNAVEEAEELPTEDDVGLDLDL